jgi:hypothetical protein
MLFEFVYEELPFGFMEKDVYSVYQSIMCDDLELPSSTEISEELRHLLLLLLDKDPTRRKGGSLPNFKKNAWFTLEWDELMMR